MSTRTFCRGRKRSKRETLDEELEDEEDEDFDETSCGGDEGGFSSPGLTDGSLTPGGSNRRRRRGSKGSGNTMAPDSTDRKKQTHLRCERQRREAINTGYSDLKDLLPSNMSPLGCKTTNASILYRACDYMRQLQADVKKASEEHAKLSSQVMALKIIAQQYENLAMEHEQTTTPGNPTSPTCLKYKMFQELMNDWFRSFDTQVNTVDPVQMTKSIVLWLENCVNVESAADKMVSALTNTNQGL